MLAKIGETVERNKAAQPNDVWNETDTIQNLSFSYS